MTAKSPWSDLVPRALVDGSELTLSVGPSAAQKLEQTFQELRKREAKLSTEVLLDRWTLFLKETKGKSRFLVAHPERGAWVATLSFSESDLGHVFNLIGARETVNLKELKSDAVSNFNLRIEFQN